LGTGPKTISSIVKIAFVALVAAAVVQELKKPREEREWHGKIANFIPYDFRMPTREHFRERFWNPNDPRVFTEHAFGVGWAINFHTVLQKMQVRGQESGSSAYDDTNELP